MIYLIAKYAILFLLATLLGMFLGNWWARRRIVDVTETFESLASRSKHDEAAWEKLWNYFGAIANRMDGLDKKVAAIPAPKEVSFADVNARVDRVGMMLKQLPVPEPVNFAPLQERIGAVESLIQRMPRPEKPEPVDLTPVHDRIRNVEQLLRSMPQPETPEPVDLGPVHNRLKLMEEQIAAIRIPEAAEPVDITPLIGRVNAIETLIQRRVDLNPINQRIGSLEQAIKTQLAPSLNGQKVDLAPLNQRISGVEQAVRAISIPGPTNLSPIEARLRAIEARLEKLAAKPAPAPVKQQGPRLMKSASFGKKDDLKRISGVGPKLERLLNKIGVFYFWQVASWSRDDVHQVDDLLEVFKGRIERDEWVKQARSLKLEPTSAKEPA